MAIHLSGPVERGSDGGVCWERLLSLNEAVGPVGLAFSCSSFAIAFFSSVFSLENLYDPLAAFVCCTNISSSDSSSLPMSQLLHFGEIVAMNAYLSPDKKGARDLTRSLTFRGWND